MVALERPAGRAVPGEDVQVVALVRGQPQRAGQGAQQLGGRLRAAGLFEAHVVVRGHAGELRHLFPAEPRSAAPRAAVSPTSCGRSRSRERRRKSASSVRSISMPP